MMTLLWSLWFLQNQHITEISNSVVIEIMREVNIAMHKIIQSSESNFKVQFQWYFKMSETPDDVIILNENLSGGR